MMLNPRRLLIVAPALLGLLAGCDSNPDGPSFPPIPAGPKPAPANIGPKIGPQKQDAKLIDSPQPG